MMAINWMHKEIKKKVDIAIQKTQISNIHPA
jgi:hypothetical protein